MASLYNTAFWQQCNWRIAVFCLISLLSVTDTNSMAVDESQIPKNILIFGGNGFIGSSTVEQLLADGYQLTLVNRGNWYWDTGITVFPHVNLIKCDRWTPLKQCGGLMDYVYQSGKVDVVIDFSAYDADTLADTLDVLGDTIGLYIFISSDSVYEVCEKNHTGATLETDAVRPPNSEGSEEIQNQDRYGHKKLQCEEVLANYRQNKGGPKYISLRLPDVVGPRDNTYRWWIYQLWMTMNKYLEKEIVIPANLREKPLSFVFVKDVANLIKNLVADFPEGAEDQAFNLAQTETPSLMELLNAMKSELELSDIEITTSDAPETIKLFPSVNLGTVNISKAENILNWSPTPLSEVVKQTVSFYESAMGNHLFDKARRDIIHMMQTYFAKKPFNVIRALRDVYHLNYPADKDEL